MKKTIAVLLTLALFCAVFTACGSKDKSANSNEILLADKLRDNTFDTIYVELELAGLTKEQKKELTGLCTQQLTAAYGSDVEVILYFAEDDPDGTLKKEMQKCPNIVCTFPDQDQVDKSQLDLLKVALAIVERIIEEINRVLATLGRPAIGGERTEATQGSTGATTTTKFAGKEIELEQYLVPLTRYWFPTPNNPNSTGRWEHNAPGAVATKGDWFNVDLETLASVLGCTQRSNQSLYGGVEGVYYQGDGVEAVDCHGISVAWTSPNISVYGLKVGDTIAQANAVAQEVFGYDFKKYDIPEFVDQFPRNFHHMGTEIKVDEEEWIWMEPEIGVTFDNNKVTCIYVFQGYKGIGYSYFDIW